MNYLIIEGFQSAAAKFAQEANINPQIDLESIHERVRIRNAILEGNIQTAVELINELNPEILDTQPRLHFALLRLQLIELIRDCTNTENSDITPALNFASSQLAHRAPQNPKFLQDLEYTMALLCFPSDRLASPLAELMDPQMRKQVASEVNEAILEAQGIMPEAKVRGLVRLRAWIEHIAATSESSRLRSIPRMELGLSVGEGNGVIRDGEVRVVDV